MGLSLGLIGLPLTILFLLVILQTGNAVTGVGTTVGFASVFSFGAIGTDGFIAMLLIAAIIAALLGLNIVSTGENQEAVHIVFLIALVLGLWGILSIAEGFPTSSPNSFFVQLNVAFSNFGTIFYVGLTFFYVIGGIGLISRGSA